MKALMLVCTLIMACSVGYLLSDALGIVGVILSLPVGLLLGMLGGHIAEEF